jgi:hypothetical protein
MDFGSLRSVTAWRLTRSGVSCEGIVVQGPEAFRLVIVEGQRIVEWTKFATASAVRQQVRIALQRRRKAGWIDASGPVASTRPSRRRHRGLLRISETGTPVG